LDLQDHELQSYPEQQQQQSSSLTLSQQDFLQRISHLHEQIGTLTTNIQAIASLHQRALAESDGGLSAQQLERVVAETQGLNQGIRDQLKFLATDANRTTDGTKSVKEQQVNTIKNKFERELRSYQEEEGQYRQRYRDQIARQYRIVNPNASEDEVHEATQADWGNEGVFQTAVCASLFPFRVGYVLTITAAHQPYRTSHIRIGQRSCPSQRAPAH
jgi:syntaxin 1B/2/3